MNQISTNTPFVPDSQFNSEGRTQGKQTLPFRKSFLWSGIMSLSPVLLVLFIDSGGSLIRVLPVLFVILVVLITLISLYPFFSASKKRWIWVSWVVALVLVISSSAWWWSLITDSAERGSSGSAVAGGLVFVAVLGIFIPIIIYAIVAGFAVRKLLRNKGNQAKSLVVVGFVFSLPFLLPLLLIFLKDGLLYLSDFV
jgi:hypothetical protein